MIARIGQAARFAVVAAFMTASVATHEGRAEPAAPPAALADAAEQALWRAAGFFRERVAVEGSYVWSIAVDGTFRTGEAHTDDRQGWVQPPGTPAVGLAYLIAYEATGDPSYLEAARSAGRALADTQLFSGGWHALMEFDPERRKAWCYRREIEACDLEGLRADNRDRDGSTLDDDITQSALRLLIMLDGLDGATPMISDAAIYGANRLLKAQYPNGAWPDRLDRRIGKDKRKAKIGGRARNPASWSRTYVDPSDVELFLLNDNLMSNTIRTMLRAHQRYGDGRFLEAAMRGGDFLLAAQMPAPQSGWAHIYSSAMEPIWARKFEPPALASKETASTIQILIDLYRYTGVERYWTAAESAVQWLERVNIGDDWWARFYELETDRPLYMNSDYELTYEDDDTPQHYGFQGEFGITTVLDAYRAMRDAKDNPPPGPPVPSDPELIATAERIIEALDEEGRWLEDGMIKSGIFVDHVEVLAQTIALASGRRIKADRLFVP